MNSKNQILKKVYKKREEIVSRNIADETILVPIRGKLADMQRIFSLNPVADFIWKKLDKEMPLERILDQIPIEFQVNEETAREDLFEFINDCIAADLLEQVL